MDDIAERIQELILAKSLSNSDFAKQTGLNPAIISHILSGRNKVSLQVVSAIKNTFTNVNLDYLITGEGQLFNDLTNVNNEREVVSETPESPSTLFPVEGVRMASVPGSKPQQYEEAEPAKEASEPENKTEPADWAATVTRRKTPQNKEVEQIVIFYSDGSFKAYHP